METSRSKPSVDVAVIGAGPAGLAAAVAAASAAATVAVVDAEPVVGGQFWRHPAGNGQRGAVTDGEVAGLHHDLRCYRRLRHDFDGHVATGRITHLARHEVWSVEQVPSPMAPDPEPALPARTGPRYQVNAILAGSQGAPGPSGRHAVTVLARTLVLATGAYDLQVPFPGWDLPGVMTAGGVQSLLKGHGVLAGQRVVVAGTGPFLLSVASGLARSGATVAGVFEAAPLGRWAHELRALPAARSKMIEATGYAWDLARHRIGYHTGATVLRADGDDRLATVTVAPLDHSGNPVTTRSRPLPADVLAVGWGFAPQLELPLMLGCRTAAAPNGAAVVLVESDQQSTVPGVYAAGEISGIGGAALAVTEGEIAGTAAAVAVARGVDGPHPNQAPPTTAGWPAEGIWDRRHRKLERRRAVLRAFADALHRVYPVPDCWIGQVREDTVVCRCEEVAARTIREVVERDGVTDARTAKLLVRPGMGWCQGRVCGYPTDRLVRAWSIAMNTEKATAKSSAATTPGSSPDEPAPTDRPIAVPIPLGLLADKADSGPWA